MQSFSATVCLSITAAGKASALLQQENLSVTEAAGFGSVSVAR